ncbi:MAG: hypothetical protein C0404_08775 [Verrucomicrobia bacterium]|nr:hypothetical protein [Verrucomicrobiota bacterium]
METKEESSGNKYYNMQYAPSPEPGVLRYYVEILRRRIWVVIAALVIVVTIGAVNVFRSPKVYRAVAKVMVERQVPKIMKFEGLLEDSRGWDPDFYKTQSELICSRAVLDKAASKPEIASIFAGKSGAGEQPSVTEETKRTLLAALGASPVPPPETWEKLRGMVSAQQIIDTHFILIRAEGGVPEQTALVANAVAGAYEQYYLLRKTEIYGDAFVFLQKEKAKEEGALVKAEKALQEYRENAKSVAMPEKSEKDQPVMAKLNELNSQLTQTQLQRLDLQSKLSVVQDIIASTNDAGTVKKDRLFAIPLIRDDPTVVAARAKILEGEKERAELSGIYGPDHPNMKAVTERINLAEKGLTQALVQTVQSIMNQTKALKAKEGELATKYEEQKGLALALAKDAFEQNRLEAEVARHRKLIEVLTERMREVDVSGGFGATNVQVVEPAGIPGVPFKPNKLRIMLVSLFFGLFAGIGLGFLFENLDDTIKTPEDLRAKLGVPLLGFVPRLENEINKKDTISVGGMISLEEPISSLAEAYRNIRTSLFYSLPAGEAKILAVTSCVPGEGKTTTACNLAIAIARTGKRVLLIDADFHRPTVSKLFALDSEKGLTNVLVGELRLTQAIQHVTFRETLVENLDVLASGADSPNPAELLGSHMMKTLLSTLRDAYDWIIVDTPPVLFVSDASIVSAICDGVILVVRAGKNNRSILLRTKEHLEALKVKIVGAVLNQMVASLAGRYYSYYYYHGYSKYSKNYHKSYYSDGRGKDGKARGSGKSGGK